MTNYHIKKIIDNIFIINLKVKKTESILVFTDDYSKELEDIAKLISELGKKFTKKIKYHKYPATNGHGIEPPKSTWAKAFGESVFKKLEEKKLLKPLLTKGITEKQIKETEKIVKKFKQEAVNVIIALSYYSTSHTKFRDLLTRVCNTRYASMPLFDKPMLKGPMRVERKTMVERTKKIAQKVNKSEGIEVKTPNGTYITLSKKGREAKADTGVITAPGSFSNLPAGEVFFAPCEGTSNGRLVLEWAPTRKLQKPITLFVNEGRVSAIHGKEKYVEYLKAKFSENLENANIAELGIGTNDKASRPDNIVESEKMLGTVHIALGDNSSFGGKVRTPFHQDFVFFKPTVTLIFKNGNKEILLKNGNLLS